MSRLLVLLVSVLGLAACASPQANDESAPETSAKALPATAIGEGVIVHLFEWRWDDIGQECETVLGPAAFAAVQVSPPSENHVVGGRPWWERYQPVSYLLETRSGSRADFAEMVAQCTRAGVDVYVDAVINHMADADLQHPDRQFSARGTAGTQISAYTYPGLYEPADFHHCGLTPGDDIADYDNREQAENCELLDLADLNSGSEKVRSSLAEYLADLASVGVAGIRIDAARHMAVTDIAAILDKAAWKGYVYQEVTQDAAAPRYRETGAVTDFSFGAELSDGMRDGSLGDLVEASFWESPNYLSQAAVVFVDNHDTQRHGHGILTYKDPEYPLAVAMMLAVPFGRPRVMSSFAFDDTSIGPPTAPGTEDILAVSGGAGVGCGDEWVCEHRWPLVLGMVGFQSVTEAQPLTRVQSEGRDRVAFVRGDRGWIAFNRSDEPWEVVHQTGLPGTSYCNVADGSPNADGTCAGGKIRVDAGMVSATVPPHGVAAIHTEAQAL
ncbi:MAG: alpha-amylase [Rhodothermales bacterium]|jgi:alpha-amylase